MTFPDPELVIAEAIERTRTYTEEFKRRFTESIYATLSEKESPIIAVYNNTSPPCVNTKALVKMYGIDKQYMSSNS